MKIRILGAGWYGCHLARALLRDGHDVHVFEKQERIFGGASGSIPARLHIGAHYPRSYDTREACQRHTTEFMAEYGFLTRGVPMNIYAIADKDSLVDYRQYVATLSGEFQFVEIHDPAEYGLQNVEGAILVPERHILAHQSRAFFERELADVLHLSNCGAAFGWDWDWTIDCTFCAQDAAGVDRYEPCVVLLLEGPVEKAITIMDGPFGSLYPWDPENGISSLSSALHTPFTKQLRTYEEARAFLDRLTWPEVMAQANDMIAAMARFYPQVLEHHHVDSMLSIRAMPRSGADTRLVSVTNPEAGLLRVRAGKIDAVLDAEKLVKGFLCTSA
jgi:NAD(P)-binding Rossmann-like domain